MYLECYLSLTLYVLNAINARRERRRRRSRCVLKTQDPATTWKRRKEVYRT